MSVRVTPLSEVAGAEVHEPRATHAFDADEQRELRALLARHHYLLWRGLDLDAPQHVRTLGYFGPLLDESHDGTCTSFVSDGQDTIVRPQGRLAFHSDRSFTPSPLRVLSLYGVEVGPAALPTIFVDTTRALATLPPALRAQIEDAEVEMISYAAWDIGDVAARHVTLPDDETRAAPVARHPAIGRHPTTGAPYLFVSELHTRRVVGAHVVDSTTVLDALEDHLYAPDNQCLHQWATGDLVVWDNLALQHGRPAPDASRGATASERVRRLRRVVSGNTIDAFPASA